MTPIFRDRADAGRRLAKLLEAYAGDPEVLVLGLPRGGLPVAYEVARALGAPLDVLLVRKLGVPGHEELAMGAIAAGGAAVLNNAVVRELRIPDEAIARVAADELRELERRARAYRGDRAPPDARGRTVILVDDGLATGSSMRAAVLALRAQQPARIVVAVPVAARSTCERLRAEVDEIVCAVAPERFQAVSEWYEHFEQTSDDEVRDILARSSSRGGGGLMDERSNPAGEAQVVRLDLGEVTLEGNLDVPDGAAGVVLFAHGSGSSRHSPRNRFVAEQLRRGGLATLLLDLLTGDEEAIDLESGSLRFDIDLLGRRMIGACDWLAAQPGARDLRIGLFGASTGAGAALVAAAERPSLVGAVVSRGGRPDLAGLALPRVQAPTLLIVGGSDYPVVSLNRDALQYMSCERGLEVVPGATHLFEEAGALDMVARLARDWFLRHLPISRSSEQ